jgi:HTH-type transcriptional regulator/antitoxin HigA
MKTCENIERKTGKLRYRSIQDVPATYRDLCSEYLPRPIHNNSECEKATAIMDALCVFETLNEEQSDYLETVTDFVEEYEQLSDSVSDPITGLEVLRQLACDQGISGADISRILGGSRMLGAMILSGKRRITADHARTLGRYFKLNPGVFVE